MERGARFLLDVRPLAVPAFVEEQGCVFARSFAFELLVKSIRVSFKVAWHEPRLRLGVCARSVGHQGCVIPCGKSGRLRVSTPMKAWAIEIARVSS